MNIIEDYPLKTKLLGILSLIMIIYSSILVYCQSIIGVSYWDIFVYLQNAMLFSHINIGSQLGVPPILSLITSIPFQLGFISENTLFAVCGILFVFLIIGLYLLLNEKYSPELSFLGSIIFSMLSLVVTWAVTGSNDLPALCFSVWAFYFTIKGLNDNFNYYYPAFLLFIVAFLCRYTEGFIFIVMLYYLLINYDKLKAQLTRKRVLSMIIYALIILVVISSVYISYQGNIPFISQFFEVSSNSQVSNVNVGYDLNQWYYFQHLPEYLTSMTVDNSYFYTLSTSNNNPTILSYVILLLVLISLFNFVIDPLISSSNVERRYLKITLIIIFSVLAIISYGHISYIITELLFTLILYLYYRWLSNKDNQLDFVMFLWIGIFIILHSYHPVKVDRYIVPIFIPLVYFMIESIQQIIKNKKKTIIILTILLLLLIPVNISYISSITKENPHTHEEKVASQFLKEYDADYTKHNISSDRGVAFSWYLKKYVYPTIPRVLTANNDSLENKLNEINAKYYIDSTSNTTNINGYHAIYDNNNEEFKLKIYERD
ncbi:MAG: glycosyltransferase family 39 protein [Methanosphaera sp.]|nr:glycosyltransferase family 39 protein [Methanosphaera sp.]